MEVQGNPVLTDVKAYKNEFNRVFKKCVKCNILTIRILFTNNEMTLS